MVSFPGMKDLHLKRKYKKGTNPNATNEKIFEQIKKYGPVSSKAIASALGIKEMRAMQSVSYMRMKHKTNIQKKGKRGSLEYFYDEAFPTIGVPFFPTEDHNPDEEHISKKEEDKLFDELVEGGDQIDPMIRADSSFEKPKKGLDILVNRCHHLILALENCSSDTIQDTFNLNQDQARVLMNKVVAKFGSGLSVSFCINVKKEK